MASVSSVISLVVLLLATYCYSVPIATDSDYTTAGYEFATGKPMHARESMPFMLPGEYTTVHSTINHRREYDADHKDGSESEEMTTERSMTDDGQQKRYTPVEVTSAPFEATSMLNEQSYDHEYRRGEYTTEHSMFNDGHQKRYTPVEITSAPFEATSMISERPAHMELSGEFTTERSYGEREIDSDSFTTFESSTEFNNRVGQMGERETIDMDTTTVYEPTSSAESFNRVTGFFPARETEEPVKGKVEVEQPETFYRKTETIVPGKITKAELSNDGQNQSHSYKETAVEHQVQSFSEGTTEENDSKTNAHY